MDLILEVVDYNILNYSLSLCDDNRNGIRNFDLNSFEGQDLLTIGNFYFTENDALNAVNPIGNTGNFQNETPYSQDVFFTIISENECNDLGVLSLIVNELPITEDKINYYCVEQFPNPITISADIPEIELANYEFLWLPGEETTSEIQVNQAGVYEVAITFEETGCTNFKTVEVIESGLPNFTLEIEEFFEENNSVTVIVSDNSIGDYEFSLNLQGPYQDSNVFENLLPGFYDVYVRDKNGCGIVQKTFGILGIMEYFTPNGDGFNDVWEFRGVFNNKEPLARIYIFDRYGKLLKTLVGLDKSWDGFFNGKPMPSQSYWYRIELQSGRVLVGHFVLKR
jgi:gliding motility-associated-like protein